MIDPTTALTTAIENSTKVANTPLFSTVIDKLLGFKISEWNAQGGVIKKHILDGYDDAKEKGLAIQYVSAFRSNTNLINIGARAAKYIDSSKSSDVGIDNDVFWGFLDHAKGISNDEMQELIAKIIAGEYNAPGTYSMSTLQILKSLGKNELEKFVLWNSVYLPDFGFIVEVLSMDREAREVRRKIGLDYASFLEMQNIGLIQAGDYTTAVSFEKDKTYAFDYGKNSIKVTALEDKTDWNFPACHQLTNAGKQILQHLDKRESPIFIGWLSDFLKKNGFEVLV